MYVSIGCYAFSKTRWSGKKMLVLAGVIGWAGLIPEPMQMPGTSVVQAADEDTESTKAKDSKNEKGQFFTPRHVIDMCVKMLNPKAGEYMIDTASGSCGFPVHTIFKIIVGLGS